MKKNSLLAYRDRGDVIHIVDADALPHTDGLAPITLVAIAIINAGYKGVIVDSYRMANGRYLHALNVDLATIEGRFLRLLEATNRSTWPSPEEFVQIIRDAYEDAEGDQQ